MSENFFKFFPNKSIVKDNLYAHDYVLLKPELREFMIPHKAEGNDIHTISSVDTLSGVTISIPAVFKEIKERFYLSGVQEESPSGVIISGLRAGSFAKIDHIEVAKDIQRTGISAAFLNDLETQCKEHGVTSLYSYFPNPVTVEFFIKHGYSIISFEALELPNSIRKALAIKEKGMDRRIKNEQDFLALYNENEYSGGGVLAVKELCIDDIET